MLSWRDALRNHVNNGNPISPNKTKSPYHSRSNSKAKNLYPESHQETLKFEKIRKFQSKQLKSGKTLALTIQDLEQIDEEIELELATAKLQNFSINTPKTTKNPKAQKMQSIPEFYRSQPVEDEPIAFKLREEARAMFLQIKTNELLDNDELTFLWSVLETNLINQLDQKDQRINYRTFRKAARELQTQVNAEKLERFFTPVTFLKIYVDDPYGRISITAFFNYVMKKTWLQQTRIGICLYDVAGYGYLRELDLESYIYELIPTLPALQAPFLEKQFEAFYVCTACRKFFFYLDPMRTGKIKIQDILACSFLDDLLELREEELSKEAQVNNWFSSHKAYTVYGNFLNLDTDMNGMLSRDELKNYGTGTLTSQFIDRVFEECVTYQGEMDYKTYLDLVLALENIQETAAQQWVFRILDMSHTGKLGGFELNYYFRGIFDMGKLRGEQAVQFEDVKDEIFDMVRPKDPSFITLKDLINSGVGFTVLQILIDFKGFWNYEHREEFGSMLAGSE